jgi:hypothetical protein
MTSPKALLAAIGLLVSVCSAHATQVRLDFVNSVATPCYWILFPIAT